MAKSFLISAVVALVIWIGSYLFLRIHQELDIQPAYAWGLAAIGFVLSGIFTMIYFRMRVGR
jgi:hypothetical protein